MDNMRQNIKTCSVCLKEEISSADPLINSCNCGDYVHKSCGAQWLEITAQEKCTKCDFKYKVRKYHKNFWQYFKEAPEEWEELKELYLRTFNLVHLFILGWVILWHNLISIKWIICLIVVTALRVYMIYKMVIQFVSKTLLSFSIWKKTHFTIEIFPIE